jgi:general secretion pathway protein G
MNEIEKKRSSEAGRAARRRRRRRLASRGLTLIEILVVVTILGLIASIVGITVANQLEEAKVDTAGVQMKNIAEALELYKIKYNRYPNTAEGIQALVSPPGGKKPLMETVPKDPWDADYIFVSPGQHNPSKFDLQSKGPDGIADSEDDVKNW